MALTSSQSEDGRTITINISGRFDFGLYRDFRETYTRFDPTEKRYQVDLSRTVYVDSSALGMLLLLREHSGGEGKDIRVFGCNEEVRKILRYSRFDRLFEIA